MQVLPRPPNLNNVTMKKKIIGFVGALACVFAGCVAFEFGHVALAGVSAFAALLCCIPFNEEERQ